MTAKARNRIAGKLVECMHTANKWYLTSTPKEVAAVHYLSGAFMVLLGEGVPYQTHADETGKYTSLTLDGVTYSVPD